MRIRPDGVELLRAARAVIGRAIVPDLIDDRHATLRAIEQAMALAEDRLTRELDASAADLAALEDARAAMRGHVLEALPQERRYDARLVAKAISVATRQLANGHTCERREYERLAALLGAPIVAHASRREIRCLLPSLNERLVTRIRAGEADVGTTTHAATLKHLEAITHEALSESNPTYRCRTACPGPSSSPATSGAARPVLPYVDASLAAWSDVPLAFLRAFPTDVSRAPITQRVDAWLHLRGVVAEAVYVSGNAAFATQADLCGRFTRRLAANPRVPMVAVESAHQAHDFAIAIADVSAALFKVVLAPFRRVEPHHAEATRWP